MKVVGEISIFGPARVSQGWKHENWVLKDGLREVMGKGSGTGALKTTWRRAFQPQLDWVVTVAFPEAQGTGFLFRDGTACCPSPDPSFPTMNKTFHNWNLLQQVDRRHRRESVLFYEMSLPRAESLNLSISPLPCPVFSHQLRHMGQNWHLPYKRCSVNETAAGCQADSCGGSSHLGFKTCLRHVLIVGPWTNHLTALSSVFSSV